MEDHQKVVKFLLSNPYTPFETAFDFKLARWMTESRIPKTGITDYFNQGLCTPAAGDPAVGFGSSYMMCRLLNKIDPDLGLAQWQRESCEVMEGTRKRVTWYYFRPLLACIQYLLRQPISAEDMVYHSIREYNDNGEKMYSKLHTADWWWKVQVSTFLRSLELLNSLGLFKSSQEPIILILIVRKVYLRGLP
jgi:hypothetical protein